MAKFKLGDKVVVVNADSAYDTYKNVDTGVVVAYDLCPAVAGYVRREDGVMMNVYWSEVELVGDGQDSREAEAIRSFILDIRSKREALHKELSQLDEQEKEAIEKLKEQGFILHEENVSKEAAVTTNKTVLYAEDIEKDMTNFLNWEHGDILKVTTYDDGILPFGALVKHVDADGAAYPYTESEYCDKWAIDDTRLKFHSRPVK